jgi:hypothetical protein
MARSAGGFFHLETREIDWNGDFDANAGFSHRAFAKLRDGNKNVTFPKYSLKSRLCLADTLTQICQ